MGFQEMERLRLKVAEEGVTLREMIDRHVRERNQLFDDVRQREEQYDATLRNQVALPQSLPINTPLWWDFTLTPVFPVLHVLLHLSCSLDKIFCWSTSESTMWSSLSRTDIMSSRS